MARILVIQNGWLRSDAPKMTLSNKEDVSFGKKTLRKRISPKKESPSGRTKISSVSWIMIFCVIMFLAGIVYLYQVNSLATKGFEIKEIENKIQEAEKEYKQLQIKEIELRSMNNIEKATEDLNLVNSADITYLEMPGPMAMK